MNAPLVHPPTADAVPSSEGVTPVMAQFLAAQGDASARADVLAQRMISLFGIERAPLALGITSLLFGFPM